MTMKLNRKLTFWMATLTLVFLLSLATLSWTLKNSGQLLVGFIEDHAVPYVLKTDDVEMGCVMAEALTLLVPSLSQLNASPYKLAIIFDFLSGSCSEFKAWEEELRYLRAIHSKNMTEAQDARIAQKRYLNLAARRQLKGYRSLELAFSEINTGGCPDFLNWNEEFYWLVGLMDGLQAVLNDIASEGNANVPLDISLKVGRGAACLSNEQWWGIPNAIQSAIWISFPADKPADVEPLIILQQSVQTGLRQGMRIVQVIAAKIYSGLGDHQSVKQLLRKNLNAQKLDKQKYWSANPQFLFLEQVASLQLQSISDAMWTEATGKRTPIGGLGTFWDDPENTVDTVDILDIL